MHAIHYEYNDIDAWQLMVSRFKRDLKKMIQFYLATGEHCLQDEYHNSIIETLIH